MARKLKPLHEQVIVITGASSGIGLATAEAAARAGAKVVIAGRSDQALSEIAARLDATGERVVDIVVDVSDRTQLAELADETIRRFGRIDTWVNNAGVSIYGRLTDVSEEDSRRLFDVNFWGVVNGSLIALPHLRVSRGALINVGSEVSEAIVPLQGMYSASKHAVKGFTDALRVELQSDEIEVAVTLIQPTAVDTPYPSHARNYLDKEPKLPTPQIKPEQVAEAILEAAVREARDVKVGAMSKINTMVAKLAPSLGDAMAAKQIDRQTYDAPPRAPAGTLYVAGGKGEKHGRPPAGVRA